MLEIIKQFVRRMLMGKGKGILQIPPQKAVDDFAADILKKFKQNGIPDEAITNSRDVKIIWEQITNREAQILHTNLTDVLKKPDPFKKAGDVVDLTGKKIDTSKPILGGKNVELTHNEKIDWLVKNVSPTAEQTIPPKPALEAMLKDGREDLIDHFFEMHTKNLGKPKVNIDTSGLKHPDLVKKMMTDEKLKPTLVKTEAQIKSKLEGMNKQTVERIKRRRYEAALKEERRKMAEDPDYIQNILDPEDFASGGIAGGGRTSTGLNYLVGEDDQNVRMPVNQGGRIPFAMGKRAFLKWLGSGIAGITAAKTGLFGLLKGGGKKAIIKDLTSVPINNIEGMPAWFKPLVNKVIAQGDDVTKGFATQERQIVHKAKLPDSQTDVLVTQDLTTGDVAVEIGAGKHGFGAGHLGQPVRLNYKASEVIEPSTTGGGYTTSTGKEVYPGMSKGAMDTTKTKQGLKTKEEFWVEEAEFTGGHPENVKFEESTFNKFGHHGSNFDEVEKFATGKVKKKTAKESIKAERAHWTPEGDDMASGGRVSLSGGLLAKGIGKFTKSEILIKMLEKTLKGSKDSWSKTNLPNFIRELRLNPKLANDPKVWNFFTNKLPKNQRLVVHSDDTVDFWTQSDFGPHNIKTTDKFMKTHPNLSRDEAVRIQNMEPEDQILEMKRLETIRNRNLKKITKAIGTGEDLSLASPTYAEKYTKQLLKDQKLKKGRKLHATGGRVPMIFGGGIFKTIIKNLAKARGVNPSEYLKITNYKALPNHVKKYVTPEDYRKMKEGRIEMFENWVEMAKSRKEFLKNIEQGKKTPAAPIFEHLEKSFKSPVPSGVTDKDILQGEFILKNLKTKDRKLNATGGLATMLGE